MIATKKRPPKISAAKFSLLVSDISNTDNNQKDKQNDNQRKAAAITSTSVTTHYDAPPSLHI